MAKLFSSERIIKVLMRKGFIFISQRGSHCKFRKVIGKKTLNVIIPVDRKEIPLGTFRSIMRQSELNEDDFSN